MAFLFGSVVTVADSLRRNLERGLTKGGTLWLVLSRCPVGEIERDASYQSDEQSCDKSAGKAQLSDVAMVHEGQQNGGHHGQGEAHYVPPEIDWFAWLTFHIR